MIGRRLYRLRPWLVRALIPPGRPGSYVLYAGVDVEANYSGRSDNDLAGRLATHARAQRGEYFSYDVHHDSHTAYLVECATYHLRTALATNVIHPAAPRGSSTVCPFCNVRGIARGVFTHPVVSEPLPATHIKED